MIVTFLEKLIWFFGYTSKVTTIEPNLFLSVIWCSIQKTLVYVHVRIDGLCLGLDPKTNLPSYHDYRIFVHPEKLLPHFITHIKKKKKAETHIKSNPFFLLSPSSSPFYCFFKLMNVSQPGRET